MAPPATVLELSRNTQLVKVGAPWTLITAPPPLLSSELPSNQQSWKTASEL